MNDIIHKFKHLLVGSGPTLPPHRRLPAGGTENQLIKLESEIGRTLFGPIPKGHAREFFCLDGSTWVWYEQWLDDSGHAQSHTIRYELHPKGIMKVEQGGKSYQFIKGEELENLKQAILSYRDRIARELYGVA